MTMADEAHLSNLHSFKLLLAFLLNSFNANDPKTVNGRVFTNNRKI